MLYFRHFIFRCSSFSHIPIFMIVFYFLVIIPSFIYYKYFILFKYLLNLWWSHSVLICWHSWYFFSLLFFMNFIVTAYLVNLYLWNSRSLIWGCFLSQKIYICFRGIWVFKISGIKSILFGESDSISKSQCIFSHL